MSSDNDREDWMMSNLHRRLAHYKHIPVRLDNYIYRATEIAPLRGTIDNALKHAFRKVFGYDPFRDGGAEACKHRRFYDPFKWTWM
jgi:hypothetical protein